MKLSFTCVLLVFAQLIWSQSAEIRFNHLTSEDGLSDKEATCFVQDDRGYMWIGTADGLNRYDGQSFKIFRATPGGLTGNNISVLQKDDTGLIWIGTLDGGLCSLNPVSQEFTAYSVKDSYSSATTKVRSIAIENSGRIHVGYEKSGGIVLDVSSGDFSCDCDSSMAWIQTCYSQLVSRIDDRLYYGLSQSGLNWRGLEDESDSSDVVSPLLSGHTPNTIYQDTRGTVWIGAWDNALHRYNPKNDEVESFVLDGGEMRFNGNEIDAISEDNHGRLWIGTRYDGLMLFNKEDLTFHKVDQRQLDRGTIKGEGINDIYKDRQNRMWVASEEGVSIYDPMLNQIEVHRLNGQEDEFVNAFTQLGDTLVLGLNTGLSYVLDGIRNDFPLKDEGKQLSVGTFYHDRRGRMLIGTNKSFYEWNVDIGRIERILSVGHEEYEFYHDIPSSFVSSIEEYDAGGLSHLLVFFFGYDMLVKTEGNPHASPNHIGRGNSYENLIRDLLVDSRGRLWAIGASKGVINVNDPFRIDSLQRATVLQADYDNRWRYPLHGKSYIGLGEKGHQLTCPDVTDLLERAGGTFWVVTNGGGLFHFDPDSEVEPFTDMKSPFNSLDHSVIDNNGDLWMSCSKGLLHYRVAEESYRLYGAEDGIPSSGVHGELFKDGEGFIYAGGKGFYLRLHPDSMLRNEAVEQSYLDQFFVHNQPWSYTGQNLSFNYRQNFLSFAFSSPNLTDPDNNASAFKLDGVDEEWRQLDQQGKVDYTSIPSGDFAFWVKSANNDGVWNEPRQLLSFSISPPWWNTWWFYLFIGLFVFATFYALYRYRLGQMKRLFEVRNEIARDLHDDLGSSLGSISIYSEVAKKSLSASDDASEVVDIIGSTSRDMMDRVGDIVWAVNPKNDAFEHMINRMQNFATPLFQANGIPFKVEISPGVEKLKLSMVQRKSVFLIFKESVHNILKYSKCSEAELKIERLGKAIHLSVSDNGVGFDTNHVRAYNGNGVINMKTRAEDIDAKLIIESSPGSGCKVDLRFDL